MSAEARTLGIDLAARPPRTAACRIVWTRRRALIDAAEVGIDDDGLTALRNGTHMTAIDSPLGWPAAFAKAVCAWERHEAWPPAGAGPLRYRLTDWFVINATGVHPLSVSSDRIGACAWRCAGLLTRWGVRSRVGDEDVAEVYPRAARICFRLPPKGAKAHPADALDVIRERCRWLEADDATWKRLRSSDHALDALICALVGRAIQRDAVHAIPAGARRAAAQEGWIHLPTGRLEDLV